MTPEIEQQVEQIVRRNRTVEADKAWEVSWVRRSGIAIITYIAVACTLLMTDNDRPFLSACIPVIGYLLGTLTLSPLKKLWLRYRI